MIPIFIYDYIYTKFYTKVTYIKVSEVLNERLNNINSVLDIGVSTGKPIYTIINKFNK